MIVESYEDVVVLSGSLHSNYWETIHTAIALTLKRHPSGVIIDCSGLRDATLAGAETFHDAIEYVHEHDRARIIVAAVPQGVLEIIRQVPNLRSQLPIANSVEEARRSLDFLASAEDGLKKKKESKKQTDRTILTCLTPDVWDAAALDLSIELAERGSPRIVVLLLVVVPRELPIQAPLPEFENQAHAFAEKAKKLLTQSGIPHTIRMERGRDVAVVLNTIANEVNATQIVLGVSGGTMDDEVRYKTLKSVLDRVTQPVAFARGKKE